MPAVALKILVGFVVGILIGMSGVGGGVLLLPVLIFGLRVPAIVAVGSDALFNFFTKVPASLMHLKKGTVRRNVVIALAMGSVPGSICGVKLLMYIRHLYGDGVNNFIKSAIGLLLIVITTSGSAVVYSPEWTRWTNSSAFQVTKTDSPGPRPYRVRTSVQYRPSTASRIVLEYPSPDRPGASLR